MQKSIKLMIFIMLFYCLIPISNVYSVESSYFPPDEELETKEQPVIQADTKIYDQNYFNPEKQEPKARTEIIEMRTSNSKVFALEDGTYQTEYYEGDIHYLDVSNHYQEIEPKLVKEAEIENLATAKMSKEAATELTGSKQSNSRKSNVNNDYISASTPFNARMPKNFATGYSIGKKQEKLTFIPVNASVNAIGTRDQKADNKVTYREAWKNTDVELIVTNRGIKENIILKNRDTPAKITFEVIGELNQKLANDALRIDPAWLIDNKGVRRDVLVSKRTEKDQTYLDLTWDSAGLTYPVIIDPTVGSIGTADDTYTDSENPTIFHGDDNILQVSKKGTNNSWKYKNAYIRFPLDFVPQSGSTITSSILKTRVVGVSGYYNADIQPYRVTGVWDKYTTYSTSPTRTSTNAGTVSKIYYNGEKTFAYWDVTAMTKDSLSSGSISIGLYSVDTNYTNQGADVSFASYTYPGCTCDNSMLLVSWIKNGDPIQMPTATFSNASYFSTGSQKLTWNYSSSSLSQVKFRITAVKEDGLHSYDSGELITNIKYHDVALSDGIWTLKLQVFNGESWSAEAISTISINTRPLLIDNITANVDSENNVTFSWNPTNQNQQQYQIIAMKKGFWEVFNSGIVTNRATKKYLLKLPEGTHDFAIRIGDGLSWSSWYILSDISAATRFINYEYNTSNQIVSTTNSTGVQVNYTYDSNGNLLKKVKSNLPLDALIAEGDPKEWPSRTVFVEDGYDDFINQSAKQPERDIRKVYMDTDASNLYIMIELGRTSDYDLIYPHGYDDDNYFIYLPMNGATSYSNKSSNGTSLGSFSAHYQIRSSHENVVDVIKFANGSWSNSSVWTGAHAADGIGSKRILNSGKMATSAILELKIPLSSIPNANLSKAVIIAASDTVDADIAQKN